MVVACKAKIAAKAANRTTMNTSQISINMEIVYKEFMKYSYLLQDIEEEVYMIERFKT
jgi:hypothetical protein